jgi:hypothetical protein
MPEQIRKQIEAAEEKMKEISGSQEVDATDPDGASASSDTSTSQADDAGKTVQPSGASEQGTKEDPNSDTYAQRWRTLQGQFNAEVPRLRGANKDLQARVAQLENLLSTVNSAPPVAAQAASQSAQKFVTDDDVAEYGESIDMMRKVTREEVGSMLGTISQLESTIQHLTNNVAGTVIPQVQRVAQQQAADARRRAMAEQAYVARVSTSRRAEPVAASTRAAVSTGSTRDARAEPKVSRAEPTVSPSVPVEAATQPASRFAGLGIVDVADTGSFDLDSALQRRRVG